MAKDLVLSLMYESQLTRETDRKNTMRFIDIRIKGYILATNAPSSAIADTADTLPARML
jgi:hypothetical protein